MAEILKITAGEETSTYPNHVLIEQTRAATFRAAGASNKSGKPDCFAPPQTNDLATMLNVASAWADEQGIHFVRVKMQVAH